MLVSAAGDGRPGANDADVFVFCGGDGGLGAGENHALHGDLENLLHARDAEGRGCVAGDDDHFRAAVEKHFSDLDAVAFHGFAAFSAVGNAGRVADVEDVFVGQESAEAGGDGEAPDAGIEDADGGVGEVRGHSVEEWVWAWRCF